MLIAAVLPIEAIGADWAAPPPDRETGTSPSGIFAIEIALRADRNLHAPRSTLMLMHIEGARRSPLWRRDLPHRPRPRFVLVDDVGRVILLDEWLNVRSEFAVMLIDARGVVLARHDLEAVRAAIGVDSEALSAVARQGVWMRSPPRLAGETVEVSAANRTLVIRLRDGALSSR